MNEIKFTQEEVQSIINANVYWPAKQYLYRGDRYNVSEYRIPKKGDIYLLGPSELVLASGEDRIYEIEGLKKLIYTKVEPKYRFICDDPTPLVPVAGDWLARIESVAQGHDTAFEFYQADTDWFSAKRLIFRREEITQ